MRINRIKMVVAMMENGMNMKELAHRADVSRSTLSYIKNGKSCKDEIGVKIAKALNVPLQDLLEQ